MDWFRTAVKKITSVTPLRAEEGPKQEYYMNLGDRSYLQMGSQRSFESANLAGPNLCTLVESYSRPSHGAQ